MDKQILANQLPEILREESVLENDEDRNTFTSYCLLACIYVRACVCLSVEESERVQKVMTKK